MSQAILAIDAATESCSAALQVNDQVIAQFEVCPQQHSQKLLPMVQQLLAQAELSLPQLDMIAFGCGPGSFTGVRIGVAVAQGLAFAADLPMAGVSSLQAMAQQALLDPQTQQVCAAIDARMDEIYLCHYQRQTLHNIELARPLTEPKVLAPEQVLTESLDLAAVGTGWQTYSQQLTAKFAQVKQTEILYPDARYMLAAARVAQLEQQLVAAEQATPLYVRDTVTWKKLPGRE